VYFFYIDESGNTGAQASDTEPVHWLVAVAIHVRAVQGVEAAMLELALRHFGDRAREPDFEFHGADLFSGRRECRSVSPTARIEMYRALACLLARHGCVLFVQGICKDGLRLRARGLGYEPAHPHTLALQFLVERFDLWLQKRQPRRGDPVLGLVVGDEQKEVDREVVRSFALWRGDGTKIGYRRRTIRFLVDTVHHVPSTDSWLLQLVDCVSYLRNRYEKVRAKTARGEEPSASDHEIVHLWRTHCAPVVVTDRVWP
jgi:Protein of unknown function (DUF3800)